MADKLAWDLYPVLLVTLINGDDMVVVTMAIISSMTQPQLAPLIMIICCARL